MESMELLNVVTLKHDVWQELTDWSIQLQLWGSLECQMMWGGGDTFGAACTAADMASNTNINPKYI
jgi:hypothetical protein